MMVFQHHRLLVRQLKVICISIQTLELSNIIRTEVKKHSFQPPNRKIFFRFKREKTLKIILKRIGTMQNLRQHSPEVEAFLASKNRGITVVKSGNGGNSKAVFSKEHAAIAGTTLFVCEGGPRKNGLKVRTTQRQKSQKVKWTAGVRVNMSKTLQKREFKAMLRNGEISVDKTGTEG